METYTNSRWRESGGGRLPTGFSSYSNHHHSLPDHNFISERRSNSHERQRVPLLTNPPTGPYHPPMLENGYNSWAGGGVRNKERLLEEDYGYHPSPPYQLDSVPVHGRGGGGGRRGTFDARRHHHISNNNSPSNSTPPHYPPGPRSNPHSWDLNGPRGSHGSNNHSGGPPMFNEGNSPLSYSPAYSDTTASSPDTRWDSPCTSSPRREIRGRGGGEPARDPRRRSHHILPQTPPPPPLPSPLPPPPQVKKEAYHFGSVDRGMTMDYSNSAARVREYDPNMRPRGYHNPSLRVNTRPGDNNYGCSRTRIYLPPMKRPRMQSKSYHIRKENGNGAFDDESQRVSKNVSIQRILFEHSYSRALPLLLQGKARVPDRKYHHRLSPYPEAALKRTMLTRTSKKVAVPPLEVKERATIPESELKGNVSETESTSSDSVMSLVDSELLDLDTDSEGGDSSRDSTDLSPLMLSIPRTLNSDLPYINRTSTNHNQPGMMNGPERRPVSPQQVSDVPDETENEAASLNNSLASSDGESFHLFMESEEEDKSGKEHKESIDIRGSHLGSLNHSQDDTLSVASSESGKSPRKIKSSFRDFIPQILETRSRAETATMRRRLAMEKKMKLHQRSISVESELHQLSPKSNSIISQDDTSSIISGGSSYQAFDYNREFSPEFVKRMKRTYATRPIGSGDSNLHKVCRSGRLRAVRYFILVEQLNVNTQDNAGWTPLHEACNNGYSDVVKALLEYGADPNLTSYDGSRPIHDAIEAGNITIVRLLVEHGANLMAEQGGKTPVDLARSLGHSDIASYLDDVLLGDQNKRQKKNVTITEVVRPSSLKKNGAVQSFADSTCHPPITLPFDGYDTGLSFGLELDSPVVFLSAVVEQSSLPFLPLYNITVSSGTNPRKHNFHILTDLLTHLSFTRETLLSKLTGIKILTLSIEEFLTQIRVNPLTKHSPIVEKLQSCPQDEVIELIPLCNALRNLLKIEVSNIDD